MCVCVCVLALDPSCHKSQNIKSSWHLGSVMPSQPCTKPPASQQKGQVPPAPNPSSSKEHGHISMGPMSTTTVRLYTVQQSVGQIPYNKTCHAKHPEHQPSSPNQHRQNPAGKVWDVVEPPQMANPETWIHRLGVRTGFGLCRTMIMYAL